MQLTSTAEGAVDANATTPCPANVTALLYCALAGGQRGASTEARRLEERADAIGMDHYPEFDSPKLWLAVARHDLVDLRRLVDSLDPVEFVPYLFDGPAALLDALVALGDDARIESDAPAWLIPGTYVEPFALRALGVNRKDERLLGEAQAHFAAMDLQWHTQLRHGS